jgi:hypothetical protein
VLLYQSHTIVCQTLEFELKTSMIIGLQALTSVFSFVKVLLAVCHVKDVAVVPAYHIAFAYSFALCTLFGSVAHS